MPSSISRNIRNQPLPGILSSLWKRMIVRHWTGASTWKWMLLVVSCMYTIAMRCLPILAYIEKVRQHMLAQDDDATENAPSHIVLSKEDCTIPHTSAFEVEKAADFVRPDTFRWLESWKRNMALGSMMIVLNFHWKHESSFALLNNRRLLCLLFYLCSLTISYVLFCWIFCLGCCFFSSLSFIIWTYLLYIFIYFLEYTCWCRL